MKVFLVIFDLIKFPRYLESINISTSIEMRDNN